MEDVLTVCSQLPVYSQMNSIYSDPSATSFDSPDLDYYKLQFLNHYRFSKHQAIGALRLLRLHRTLVTGSVHVIETQSKASRLNEKSALFLA